jgi:hypothetical protein
MSWQFIKSASKLGLLSQTGSRMMHYFFNNINYYWDILHSFCLSNYSMSWLISVVTPMYPSWCPSVRHILVLYLTFFMKLNICSHRQLLHSIDYSGKVCLLIPGNCFSSFRVIQYHRKYEGCTKHIDTLQVVI